MIAANRPVTVAMAEQIADVFTEVIVAPDLRRRRTGDPAPQEEPADPACSQPARRARRRSSGGIAGGILVQTRRPLDATATTPATGQLVSRRAGRRRDPCRPGVRLEGVPLGEVQRDPARHRRRDRRRRDGPGEPGRLVPARGQRAGDRAAGSVAASDAFFPFADGPQILIDAGVTAIVQPGGSVRDADVIEAAQAAGVTMYFTGTRHFFH